MLVEFCVADVEAVKTAKFWERHYHTEPGIVKKCVVGNIECAEVGQRPFSQTANNIVDCDALQPCYLQIRDAMSFQHPQSFQCELRIVDADPSERGALWVKQSKCFIVEFSFFTQSDKELFSKIGVKTHLRVFKNQFVWDGLWRLDITQCCQIVTDEV